MAFSEAGLSKIKAVLEEHVARGSVPGLVALVEKCGKAHVFPVGTMTLEGNASEGKATAAKTAVRRDTIFRIASMTKPITAAAAMMLIDEGKLRLDEPIDRGMADTAFDIPREKLDRFTTAYVQQDGKLGLFDPPDGKYLGAPSFPAGDSGLISTADDFAAFARFMTSGLAPDGRRLLSESSLRAMKTDHLTAAQREGGAIILGQGRGWGYGVGVRLEASQQGVTSGAYGWDGGFGTSWFTDPSSDLTAILLTQRLFDSPDPPQVHKDFWQAACAE